MLQSGLKLYHDIQNKLSCIFLHPSLLLLRIILAIPFWKAGLTKFHYVQYNQLETLYFLFEEYNVPFLSVKFAAWSGMLGELILSVLLVFGLFTRISALGLLILTGVVYYVDGNDHAIYWAGITFFLAMNGAGRLSLDHFLSSYCRCFKR